MSINDFEIIKQIGSGAFSTVSLVKNKKDNKLYALKRVELSKMMSNEKDNSLNEIRLLASVNHKNIIAYKQSFYEESTNTLNLVLEYADGGDLQSKITAHKNIKKYFNEKTIWSIFIQMVYGIKELHDRNIVHRDLKSANIFLMKNGICKLGDLNVSKVAKSGLLKTQTGTPYFASPEVWGGKPYGLKSDIWSLGCILYQMATLKMPFQGNNFKEVYSNISKCKYQPLPDIYSNELDSIIKKLLQIEPEKRPNCHQILKDPIVVEKLKTLFGTDISRSFNEEDNLENLKNNIKDNNNNELSKKASNDIKNINKEIKNDSTNQNSSKVHNNTSRLLKALKYNKEKNINEILTKDKGYKIYNNYRIFKNYDTNPSSKEEKKVENDDKLNNDNNINGYNKKFYNKSNINKYKTINSIFLKAKTNLNENENKSESKNKNSSNALLSKTINKTNSVPYINHRSEGNSINNIKKNTKKEKEEEKHLITSQVKIPLLISKNKTEQQKKKNSIPRNCITSKNRRKALSENKNIKYYNNNSRINMKISNNYQFKKITPLITNSNNDSNIISNVNNAKINNQKKRLTDIIGKGYEFNQTDIVNNKEIKNMSEKGKSFAYNRKLENKCHNLNSKQHNKNYHSLPKNKRSDLEETAENNYNKQFRKSIPKSKSNTKNISSKLIEKFPVKPKIKVSNLFNNKGFNENSKINSYVSNKFNNSFHYTLKTKEVKRNNSTFEINNLNKQKIFTLNKLSSINNNSQNGLLDFDLNNLTKNKYTIVGEKLSLPSTKGSESVSLKNNKYNTNRKKIFRKNNGDINISEYNHFDNKENSNNIFNYSNTASNRINIYRQNNSLNNNNSVGSKKNPNIQKSISLISIDKPIIYNTHINNQMKKKSNEDNSKDNSDSIHKKISVFKFNEFKQKRLKKSNTNIKNEINEKKKKFIKFNHMPFINTPNKENEPIITKNIGKKNPSSSDKNNNDLDPSIKMLINPIKIIEKKNFKRKLFPVHPQVKLNKLNLLNDSSYKNNNKDLRQSINDVI